VNESQPQRGTGERDAILARVRKALETPTSAHVKQGTDISSAHSGTDIPECVSDSSIEKLLPPVGPTIRDRIENFQNRSNGLRTDFQIVNSTSAAAALLNHMSADLSWQRVAIQNADLLNQLASSINFNTLQIDSDYDPHAMEQCDAGITVCDALIAQTGSVMLTTASAGGRALSVLPPHHVVIATVDQLLPDLPAAFALLQSRYGDRWPSFATFITGPSRTGDIERILVLGAHGPKKLTVILIHQE
jgi:L-lactate dehydrogenase complex protein LldG